MASMQAAKTYIVSLNLQEGKLTSDCPKMAGGMNPLSFDADQAADH